MNSPALMLGAAPLPAVNRPRARLTVLDVTKWFGETSGGVRTYLREKAAFVRQHPDLRHVLVIPGADDSVEDGDGTRTYRLRGPRIPTQQQYRFLLATRTLRHIVEHERPDLIEVGSQIFVPWVARLATRRRPTPLVGFYHGNVERALEIGLDLASPAADLSRAVARRYLRAVDRLFVARFAASDALAADLARAGVAPVTRIRLGVDTATFTPRRKRHRVRVRSSLGVGADEPMVLYCGRIAAEKDVAWLVEQWRHVVRHSAARLVLVGEGSLKAELMQATQHGTARVSWLPFEPDRERLADLLACADAVIAPGPVETFGLSALEAMACGTPVISVDRGAGAELVRRAGAGWTYEWRDSMSFAATMGTVLSGSDTRLGERGRAFAEREHRWDRAFDEIFEHYHRIVRR